MKTPTERQRLIFAIWMRWIACGAGAAMGRPGRAIVKVCTFGVNFGCIVAFINVISDVLSSVAGSALPPAAEPSRQAIMMAVVLGAMIPLSVALNSPAALGTVSLTSVGLIVVFSGAPPTSTCLCAWRQCWPRPECLPAPRIQVAQPLPNHPGTQPR